MSPQFFLRRPHCHRRSLAPQSQGRVSLCPRRRPTSAQNLSHLLACRRSPPRPPGVPRPPGGPAHPWTVPLDAPPNLPLLSPPRAVAFPKARWAIYIRPPGGLRGCNIPSSAAFPRRRSGSRTPCGWQLAASCEHGTAVVGAPRRRRARPSDTSASHRPAVPTRQARWPPCPTEGARGAGGRRGFAGGRGHGSRSIIAARGRTPEYSRGGRASSVPKTLAA